ncbi:PIG-L deacetylase family protein [Bacillus sp. RO1]|uniref:PIG-L deacetylase family protein n=1 Tax=Bacillus sp. RO1 TaxID=2722703 RepID=UPI00145767E0|nr:PIG-L deacetylase family protein [Bacillus sp. RO1]NLP52720.1 PIG-L family deacetylase [Bacillus sp. RO1]
MKRKLLKLANPFISILNKGILTNYFKDNREVQPLPESRVLYLAPHVDDETIGAGGTLLKYAEQGCETHVIFLTDGSGSHTKGDVELLVKKRKEEAAKAQEFLHLTSIQFYDEKDRGLKSTPDLQMRLKTTIEEIRPHVIYIPVFVDCHPDHVMTGKLLRDTLELLDQSVREELKVRLYEINTLIPKEEINFIVDITSQMERKEQAVNIFQSQTIDFDGFIELSLLKSVMVKDPSVRAVETFLDLTPSNFIKRYDEIDGKYVYSNHFKQVNKSETLLYAIYKNLKMKKDIYRESSS